MLASFKWIYIINFRLPELNRGRLLIKIVSRLHKSCHWREKCLWAGQGKWSDGTRFYCLRKRSMANIYIIVSASKAWCVQNSPSEAVGMLHFLRLYCTCSTYCSWFTRTRDENFPLMNDAASHVGSIIVNANQRWILSVVHSIEFSECNYVDGR